MKKVVYLHGLETPQGGEKVSFLAANSLVFAPSIDYRNRDETLDLFKEILLLEPDLIIGSSIGGYMAYALGTYMETPVILFNPALHSRTIDFEVYLGGHSPKGICVLGMKDPHINPLETLKIIRKENLEFVKIESLRHSIPFEVFTDIYNKYSSIL